MSNPLRFLGDLRDFIYPPVCYTCDSLIENGPGPVCPGCWSSFRTTGPGDSVWHEVESAMKDSGLIDAFCSCYLFEKEGKLQEVMHLLKYSGLTSAGIRFGHDLGKKISGEEPFMSADFMVPVPLHRTKKRERGYNQSEFICRGMAEVSGIPVLAKCVARTRNTGSQTRLGKEERRENVSGAFLVRPQLRERIRGMKIILVDDVVTTSATMTACAAALRDAGAEKIFATSIALAL